MRNNKHHDKPCDKAVHLLARIAFCGTVYDKDSDDSQCKNAEDQTEVVHVQVVPFLPQSE